MRVSFCAQCGNKLPQKATFCPFCGTKIDRSVEDIEDPSADSAENKPEPALSAEQVPVESFEQDTATTVEAEAAEMIIEPASQETPESSENVEVDPKLIQEETQAQALADAIYDSLYEKVETIHEAPASEMVDQSVAPPKKQESQPTKEKDKSWIWAVVVVAIACAVSGYNAYLKRETDRMGKEIIEKFGGYENMQKALDKSRDNAAKSGYTSFEYDCVKTKLPSGWQCIKKESFDLGVEITLGNSTATPQKTLMITVMDKYDDYSVKQYLSMATNNVLTDPAYKPCHLSDPVTTTFYGHSSYTQIGYFQKHDDWQQNVKYVAYTENGKVVILLLSNMQNDIFTSSDFETICKELKVS